MTHFTKTVGFNNLILLHHATLHFSKALGLTEPWDNLETEKRKKSINLADKFGSTLSIFGASINCLLCCACIFHHVSIFYSYMDQYVSEFLRIFDLRKFMA